ncbi:MAG: hypothetical protein IT503_11165 [Burkholderiaceae bacterium]|nr:hypothetical protein [Burkholderiaceae bacterium]
MSTDTAYCADDERQLVDWLVDSNEYDALALGKRMLLRDKVDPIRVLDLCGVAKGIIAKRFEEDLRHSLECALLTLAVPSGCGTVLAKRLQRYEPLPANHYVLMAYRRSLEQRGSNELRVVRKFYKA